MYGVVLGRYSVGNRKRREEGREEMDDRDRIWGAPEVLDHVLRALYSQISGYGTGRGWC